jgi:hypothetical protein
MSRRPHVGILLLGLFLMAGCMEAKKPAKSESTGEGIFHKTTQEVGKYDPNGAFQVVSDHKVHATDPLFAGLQAYGPIMEQIVDVTIKPSIAAFEIENNHYPSYEEFMERIIKANNVQLPVLPFKGKYMYDEAKHELLVVRHPDDVAKMESLSK